MKLWARILILVAVSTALFAGNANADEGRKVKSRVNAVYPELAKKVNAGGSVRLEIQIAPSGEVKNVKVLGGHPLLIPAAEDAIKKWRYEPGSETTTTIVEFRFAPGT